MGMYGSVVIHPIGGRAPGRKRREAVARDIVRAFERVALLPSGTADAAHASPATDLVGCKELPSGVEGVRLRIGGWGFLAGITDLIFAWTWSEYHEGLDLKIPEGESPEQFVFPILDVVVSSKSVRSTHFDGELAFQSWAMVEFSFGDIRANLEEVHRIRNEEHPLFRELASILGTEVAWTVVIY